MKNIAIWGDGIAGRYIGELLGENVKCIIDDGVSDIHRAAIDHEKFLHDFQEMTDIEIVTNGLLVDRVGDFCGTEARGVVLSGNIAIDNLIVKFS